MRSFFLLFALGVSLFATESLKLGVSVTGTANMNTAATPFRRADVLDQTQVFQFRLHSLDGGNIPAPGSRQDLFTINGSSSFWIFVNTDGTMGIIDWFDSFAGGDGNNLLDINGRSDVIVQIVRKILSGGTSQFWVELWNIDGTGYQLGAVKTITSRGDGPSGGGTLGQVNMKGGGLTGAALAWWRWKAGGSIDTNGPAPKGSDTVSGYMAAYEFESESSNNSPDSSAHNTPLALTGTRQYVTSPVYFPACSGGAAQSFRAGIANHLDASASGPLDEGSTLTYEWQQISGPTSLNWSSHTTQQPVITGSVAGTYNFQLRVTDGSAQRSACTVTHGFVATDSKGVALVSNTQHAPFIQNLTRMGVNPWPWQDQQQKKFLDWLVGNIDTFYSPYWDTEDEGTIQINSSQIIGTGTHFQALFCNGGTTPAVDANSGTGWFQIVIHYPYVTGQGYDGLTGHQELPVWRCTSDTVMEIGRYSGDSSFFWAGNALIPGTGTAGLKYNIVDGTKRNRWVFGSRPLNYYDQVLALYATYYRTGNIKYRDTARTLADRFWQQPWLDRAARYDGSGQGIVMPNRSLSLTGIIMRAIDSPPVNMWPALRRMQNYLINIAGLSYPPDGFDFREGGYAIKWFSEIGILDPASQTAAVNKVLDMLTNKWTPQRQADGSWNNFSGGWFHTALGGITGVGTVVATNGSAAIVGSGSNLDSGIGGADGCLAGNYIVFYPTTATFYRDASGANTGDPIGYLITSITDSTHMALASPYTGTTGSKYWACGSRSIGMGKQPFMLGILAQAFMRAADLLTASNATTYTSQISLYRSYAADVGNWLLNHRSPDGGIFYFKTTPNCEGLIVSSETCDNTQDGNIINYAEASYAAVLSYVVSPSSALATTNDAVWSMMFGKPASGALAEDSRYMWELENYMADVTKPNDMGKWLGFFWGVGRTPEWPAIRLGGLDPANNTSVPVSLGLPAAANPACTSWRLTVTDANGTASSPIACSTATCSVTADARQSGATLTASCLSSGGAPVRTINLPFQVQ